MSRSQSSLYDRQITIFSPEGKLFQVEYAFRAVDAANVTAVALKSKECAVIVCQKKASSQALAQDTLLDPSSMSSLYNITEKIGGAYVGIPGDSRAMVFRSRQKAAEFMKNNAIEVPLPYLATKMANINQVYTQHAYMRLQACVGIMIGTDKDQGNLPLIYRFDPAGWVTGNHAAVVGHKEQEAISHLEKTLKKKDNMTKDETIMSAIVTLQSALGQDLKASDVEVAIVTKDDPTFRRLREEEVDHYLTLVAERD